MDVELGLGQQQQRRTSTVEQPPPPPPLKTPSDNLADSGGDDCLSYTEPLRSGCGDRGHPSRPGGDWLQTCNSSGIGARALNLPLHGA